MRGLLREIGSTERPEIGQLIEHYLDGQTKRGGFKTRNSSMRVSRKYPSKLSLGSVQLSNILRNACFNITHRGGKTCSTQSRNIRLGVTLITTF